MKKQYFLILAFLGADQASMMVADEFTSMQKIACMAAIGLSSAVVTTGTATYWYNRESNASKIEKVEGLWNHINGMTANIRQENFYHVMPAFKNLRPFIDELKNDMDSRYARWTAPWNWGNAMFIAHKKMTLLSFLSKYVDIMYGWQVNMPDDAIEALGKKVCPEPYSATKLVKMIQNDIAVINKLTGTIQCSFGTFLVNYLVSIRNIVMQSNSYVRENHRANQQV